MTIRYNNTHAMGINVKQKRLNTCSMHGSRGFNPLPVKQNYLLDTPDSRIGVTETNYISLDQLVIQDLINLRLSYKESSVIYCILLMNQLSVKIYVSSYTSSAFMVILLACLKSQ